jgi:hypothetical protein
MAVSMRRWIGALVTALVMTLAGPAAQAQAWGLPGGHVVWNDSKSWYGVGLWDYEAHYWITPRGQTSDQAHPYIPRPNGALEWVNVQAINIGPGSCGFLYKMDRNAHGVWYWRYLWVAMGYSQGSGNALAYHISGLPNGQYLWVGSFQLNGNGQCVWSW